MRWNWRAAPACGSGSTGPRVPLLPGVRELAGHGMVTGASGRNWAGYGHEVELAPGFAAVRPGAADRPADQRRPAGVLRAEAVDDVLAVFRRHGFDAAA